MVTEPSSLGRLWRRIQAWFRAGWSDGALAVANKILSWGTAAASALIPLLWLVACSSLAQPQPRAASGEIIPIIWDDDGSADGVTALLYFLEHPSYEVVAATVSPGIAHPNVFAPQLADFLTMLGEGDIPVAAGRESPLAGDNAFPAAWRESSDRFWDLEIPDSAAGPDARTAAQLIVDIVNNSERPLTVFVSGPLTNLAEALRSDPGITDSIRSVEVMGGVVDATGTVSTVEGRPDPVEWNIFVDPDAAQEVFSSGLPIRITPLDATDRIGWTAKDAASWEAAGGPGADRAAQLLRWTLDEWGSSDVLIWDLVAAINTSHDGPCQWRDLHLDIAPSGAPDEGQMNVSDSEPPNVSTCLSPTASAYKDLAREVFATP